MGKENLGLFWERGKFGEEGGNYPGNLKRNKCGFFFIFVDRVWEGLTWVRVFIKSRPGVVDWIGLVGILGQQVYFWVFINSFKI